jgi:hypothetical protein
MRFLTAQTLYRLLQQELPEDVYPDGAPADFLHTADTYATAQVLGGHYTNLERVFLNAFPADAEELIQEWELTIMGNRLDQSATDEQRKNRYLQRLRSPRGISIPRLEGVVRSVLGEMVDFEIVESNCEDGTWVLDESQLDISTILNALSGVEEQLRVLDPNCQFRESPPPGISAEDWEDYRNTAYSYEVRIYNQTLTETQMIALDQELSRSEPARSAHTIIDSLTDEDRVHEED